MKRELACAVAILLTGTPLHAQQRDSILTDMVTGLFGGGGPNEPQITVGELPAGFEADLLPDGARVLGGVAAGDATNLVAIVRGHPGDVAAKVMAHLVERGWRAQSLRDTPGFVAAELGNPFSYCRGSARGFVSTFVRDTLESYLRITHHASIPVPCEDDRSPRRTGGPPLPSLIAPGSAITRGSGAGGGGGGWNVSTLLETQLGPAELVNHYAPQLAAAGWTVQGTSFLDGAAIAVVRREFPDDGVWIGALVAIAIAESRLRDVYLRVSRADP